MSAIALKKLDRLAIVPGVGLKEADTAALLKCYEQIARQRVRLPQ
jgi:hypothetical protein